MMREGLIQFALTLAIFVSWIVGAIVVARLFDLSATNIMLFIALAVCAELKVWRFRSKRQ